MDYKIRFATPDDHDLVYGLKAESVRPYVEKIWGWPFPFPAFLPPVTCIGS